MKLFTRAPKVFSPRQKLHSRTGATRQERYLATIPCRFCESGVHASLQPPRPHR